MNILCSPGMLSRIEDAPLDLLTDWSSRLMNARLKIVQQCAKSYIEKNPQRGEIYEIHDINAFRNYVATELGIPSQDDIFAPAAFDLGHLNQFRDQALAAIHISSIAPQIAQTLIAPFEGNFSLQKPNNEGTDLEKFEALKKPGKDLNLLGKDPYLIANPGKLDLSSGESDDALCCWIFKADDDGEYMPRSLEEIEFIIQCTITARLNQAGYLAENAIASIELDDQYQLVLLPSDINSSWIQAKATHTPPESLEKFLARKPEYREHIETHLETLLNEHRKKIHHINDLLKILPKLPETWRLSFSVDTKTNWLPSILTATGQLFLTHLSKIVTYLSLQDYPEFLNLVEVKDALGLIFTTGPTNEAELNEFLKSIPNTTILFYLQAIEPQLPHLISANLAILLVKLIPKEHYVAFLKLTGIKNILAQEFTETLKLPLVSTLLPDSDNRWFFVQNILEILPELKINVEDFFNAKGLFLPKHHQTFLEQMFSKISSTITIAVSTVKCNSWFRFT